MTAYRDYKTIVIIGEINIFSFLPLVTCTDEVKVYAYNRHVYAFKRKMYVLIQI